MHEAYKDTTLNNDIALLRLAHPVDWTDSIRPICLTRAEAEAFPSSQGDNLENLNCVITGWGRTETGKVGSKE